MKGAFWDRISGLYDAAEKTNWKVNAQTLRQVSEWVPTGAKVLDCAAGTGEFSLAAEKAESVLCTDLSLPMLKRAEKKARRRKAGNLEFAVRDLTALPEEDGSFDVVIAANVLHLLREPEKAVRELWRVTRPGGRLILPTYLQGEVGKFKAAFKLYELVGFRYESAFTLESYRSFLEGLGLGPVCMELVPGRMPSAVAMLEKL